MTEETRHNRLETALAKLRQKELVSGSGRVLRGGSADALIAAIVTEIEETILPRRLSMKTDGGATLHFAAANRRLQALLSPAADAAKQLENVALKDAEDENVARLLDVLKTELATSTSLTVTSSRLGAHSYPSDIGVPSNILSRTWNLASSEKSEVGADEIVQDFLASLDNQAIGWIQIEGEEVTAESGEEEFIAELSEQAALFLDGYFAKSDALFSEHSVGKAIALGPQGNGTAILFVDYNDTSAFIALPSAGVGTLATQWQKTVVRNG